MGFSEQHLLLLGRTDAHWHEELAGSIDVGGADLGGMDLAGNADLSGVELANNMELGGAQKVTPHGAGRCSRFRTGIAHCKGIVMVALVPTLCIIHQQSSKEEIHAWWVKSAGPQLFK